MRSAVVVLLLGAVACTEDIAVRDSGTGPRPFSDARTNTPDGAADGGAPFDGGTLDDGGRPGDANIGPTDSGDAGTPGDTGVPPADTGVRDAAAIDTGTPDTGAPDTGAPQPGTCSRSHTDGIEIPPPPGADAFREVKGIAIDPNGTIYVLNKEGTTAFVSVIGPAPTYTFRRSVGRGDLGPAQDVTADGSGNIYVVEYQDPGAVPIPRVSVYSAATGNRTNRWTLMGGGQDEAWSITLDMAGRLVIGGLIVSRYETDGDYIDGIGRWGDFPGGIGRSQGLFTSPGFIWVADLARNKFHQLDAATRTHVAEFGARGSADGQFDGGAEMIDRWGPTKIALDMSGNIYVNDPFVSRIMKFDRRGAYRSKFEFGGPMDLNALAVEPRNGNIYVGRRTGVDIVCPF